MVHTGSTQILTLHMADAQKLTDQGSIEYQLFDEVLHTIEKSNGLEQLIWGLGVERYWEVHIHIVRRSLQKHKLYLASPAHSRVLELLRELTQEPVTIRHASMQQFTPDLSPFHAPFTGTAIYLDCKSGIWDAAWNLWTHIVPSVDGCSGVAGGYVHELVKGKPRGYLVYVGWTGIEKHEQFHRENLFQRYRNILGIGNAGWTEYGHVRFMEERDLRFPPKL